MTVGFGSANSAAARVASGPHAGQCHASGRPTPTWRRARRPGCRRARRAPATVPRKRRLRPVRRTLPADRQAAQPCRRRSRRRRVSRPPRRAARPAGAVRPPKAAVRFGRECGRSGWAPGFPARRRSNQATTPSSPGRTNGGTMCSAATAALMGPAGTDDQRRPALGADPADGVHDGLLLARSTARPVRRSCRVRPGRRPPRRASRWRAPPARAAPRRRLRQMA